MTTASPLVTGRTPGVGVIPLNNGLWRVTRASGVVLGYVQQLDGYPERFAAKRLLPSGRGFRPVGEFRSFPDALDCLRFG